MSPNQTPLVPLTNNDFKPSCAPQDSARAFDVSAVKEMRRTLDSNLQTVKGWKPSRERSLTITKVQEAIMWLGMDLKRLNEPNPYPTSYDPSSPVIEPTADGLKL